MFAISKSSHITMTKNSKLMNGNPYEMERDIRKYKQLYMYKLNEENLETLIEELAKIEV